MRERERDTWQNKILFATNWQKIINDGETKGSAKNYRQFEAANQLH